MPPIPHNIILFELDFDVKFPLSCLLQFLIDLKSTILFYKKYKHKTQYTYIVYFRLLIIPLPQIHLNPVYTWSHIIFKAWSKIKLSDQFIILNLNLSPLQKSILWFFPTFQILQKLSDLILVINVWKL